MAVWNNVEKILLGTVCLTSLMLPYESFAAERPYDNKNTQRRSSSRRDKESRDSKNTRREQEKKETYPLSSKDIQDKISNIRRNIERAPSDDMKPGEKKIILTIFDQLVQTDYGKKLFERVHPDLRYVVKQLPLGNLGNYNAGRVQLNRFNLQTIENAKTMEKQLSYILVLAGVIAHETSHAEHSAQGKISCLNGSFEEKVSTKKMSELHGNLENARAPAVLLDLPPYKPYYEQGKLTLLRDTSLYLSLRDAKFHETNDMNKSERFATTTFVTHRWENRGEETITVNNKDLTIPRTSATEWNTRYNIISYASVSGLSKYNNFTFPKKDTGMEAHFNYFVERLDLDIPASFFVEKKSFRADQDRLVGYMNNIKNMEIESLQYGTLTKIFINGNQLDRFSFNIDSASKLKLDDVKIKNGRKTEVYSSTKHLRAEYVMSNGTIDGIYKEYDENGAQRFEIPVKGGKGNGYGWIMVDGKKNNVLFKNDGNIVDVKTITPAQKANYDKQYIYKGR